MPRFNEIERILKDTSGASIVFVLGIMLLLLTVGTSALMLAASVNNRLSNRQNEYIQVRLLDESIHKSVKYSLTYDPKAPDCLWVYLIQDVLYRTCNPEDEWMANLSNIPLKIGFETAAYDVLRNIIQEEDIEVTLSFLKITTDPYPSVPMEYMPASLDPTAGNIPYPDEHTARQLKIYTINAQISVTVRISINGNVYTTVAIYDYTGGKFTDAPDKELLFIPEGEIDRSLYPMRFCYEEGDEGDLNGDGVPDGFGVWRLISYEKLG
jgi:hypothetical protein